MHRVSLVLRSMLLPTSAGLRHLPFFEALAELEMSSPEWASISAGLVTLRLFDLRRAQENGGAVVVAAEVGAVRDAIAAMPASDIAGAILGGVVESAADGLGARTERALPALLAYGRALQLAARWSLAADVFETILEHPAAGEQGDLALQAALKCASSLRASGRFEEAELAYDRVRRISHACDDRSAAFLAEIGRANIALQRGNYPRAEEMLDAVIASADDAGCPVALSRALHDRGHVAYRRGRREESLDFLHRALVRCTEPGERDRLLADIALVLGELGHVEVSREVQMLIERTAQEQSVRWLATINLVELAVKSGRELQFERHRRQLADVALPPHLEVLYQLHVGEGYQRFGRGEARAAIAAALSIARQHELHDLGFRAEAALDALDRPAPRAAPTPSAVVDDILRTVRGLHETVEAFV